MNQWTHWTNECTDQFKGSTNYRTVSTNEHTDQFKGSTNCRTVSTNEHTDQFKGSTNCRTVSTNEHTDQFKGSTNCRAVWTHECTDQFNFKGCTNCTTVKTNECIDQFNFKGSTNFKIVKIRKRTDQFMVTTFQSEYTVKVIWGELQYSNQCHFLHLACSWNQDFPKRVVRSSFTSESVGTTEGSTMSFKPLLPQLPYHKLSIWAPCGTVLPHTHTHTHTHSLLTISLSRLFKASSSIQMNVIFLITFQPQLQSRLLQQQCQVFIQIRAKKGSTNEL